MTPISPQKKCMYHEIGTFCDLFAVVLGLVAIAIVDDSDLQPISAELQLDSCNVTNGILQSKQSVKME